MSAVFINLCNLVYILDYMVRQIRLVSFIAWRSLNINRHCMEWRFIFQQKVYLKPCPDFATLTILRFPILNILGRSAVLARRSILRATEATST